MTTRPLKIAWTPIKNDGWEERGHLFAESICASPSSDLLIVWLRVVERKWTIRIKKVACKKKRTQSKEIATAIENSRWLRLCFPIPVLWVLSPFSEYSIIIYSPFFMGTVPPSPSYKKTTLYLLLFLLEALVSSKKVLLFLAECSSGDREQKNRGEGCYAHWGLLLLYSQLPNDTGEIW